MSTTVAGTISVGKTYTFKYKPNKHSSDTVTYHGMVTRYTSPMNYMFHDRDGVLVFDGKNYRNLSLSNIVHYY